MFQSDFSFKKKKKISVSVQLWASPGQRWREPLQCSWGPALIEPCRAQITTHPSPIFPSGSGKQTTLTPTKPRRGKKASERLSIRWKQRVWLYSWLAWSQTSEDEKKKTKKKKLEIGYFSAFAAAPCPHRGSCKRSSQNKCGMPRGCSAFSTHPGSHQETQTAKKKDMILLGHFRDSTSTCGSPKASRDRADRRRPFTKQYKKNDLLAATGEGDGRRSTGQHFRASRKKPVEMASHRQRSSCGNLNWRVT